MPTDLRSACAGQPRPDDPPGIPRPLRHPLEALARAAPSAVARATARGGVTRRSREERRRGQRVRERRGRVGHGREGDRDAVVQRARARAARAAPAALGALAALVSLHPSRWFVPCRRRMPAGCLPYPTCVSLARVGRGGKRARGTRAGPHVRAGAMPARRRHAVGTRERVRRRVGARVLEAEEAHARHRGRRLGRAVAHLLVMRDRTAVFIDVSRDVGARLEGRAFALGMGETVSLTAAMVPGEVTVAGRPILSSHNWSTVDAFVPAFSGVVCRDERTRYRLSSGRRTAPGIRPRRPLQAILCRARTECISRQVVRPRRRAMPTMHA